MSAQQIEQENAVKVVLIVEDDDILGDFLLEVIRQQTTYQAFLARNGFEALNIVRSFKPDLLVVDYFLPSMNGVELYDHLHLTQGLEDTPTLFMSANAPTDELEKRRVYLIKKPFELEELMQMIQVLAVT